MKTTLKTGLLVALLASSNAALANPEHDAEGTADHVGVDIQLIMPKMDAELGRELFGSKGCVTCHSINDVGGEDASALDAHDMEPYMNPFDLAAKMWRMAPFMIEAQEEELGEQIQFTGDELSAIIAFLHDDAEQHEFTLESLSPEMQEMLEQGHSD